MITAKPDLVVFAGDTLHHVRPSNVAVIEAFRQLQRLTTALPGVPVIVVCGNHEQPRSSETGCILRLFTEIRGVRVALEPTTFRFDGLSVRCLPDSPRPIDIGEPDPTARYNVLVAHGETPAMAARWSGDLRPHNTLDVSRFAGWDYVALGHYHVAHEVAPNAWYSGSLEYTSSNPWDELREEQERGLDGKGWLLAELATAPGLSPTVDFQPVRTRMFVDLPPIDAAGLTAADVMDGIAAQLPAQLAGVVVRQKVLNLAKDTVQGLDHERIRVWKAEALNFQLDLRRAPLVVANGVMGAVRKRATVAEAVADFFARREWSPDVDRERVANLAEALIAEATVAEEANL
jgi:hypothetical protein